MRELRTCPVTGVTVLLNDGWPDGPLPAAAPPTPCWACAARAGGHGPVLGRKGEVVAVPHPVPALGVEGEVRPQPGGPGIRREAVGAHELMVGTHEAAHADALLLAAERMADLRGDPRLRGFGLLRRAAPEAHPLWELVAFPTDVAPTDARAWRDAERGGPRRIAAHDGAIAVAAWAPRAPWEVWVLSEADDGDFPVAHRPVAALAERVLLTLHRWLGGCEVRMTVEWGTPWRLVLRPMVRPSLGTDALGVPGHGVFPERAARELRARVPTA